MKKTIFIPTMVLILGILLGGCNRQKSADEITDKICNLFETMSNEIKACKSIADLEKLSFNKSMLEAESSGLDDKSLDVEMTKANKEKIKKALDNFIGVSLEKASEFMGGDIDKSLLDAQLEPIKQVFNQRVDDSKTFKELFLSLEQLNL